MSRLAPLLVLLAAAAACQRSNTSQPISGSGSTAGSGGSALAGSGRINPHTGSGGMSPKPQPQLPPAKDIDSKDILARKDTADRVFVKHVLLGWKDLAVLPQYQGHMDPRAEKRTNDDAAKLAQDILGKLKAKPDDIDALVKQYSEDPGGTSGEPYEVAPDTAFVPEFKLLALRLKEKEAGIVKTSFGYHVIERIPPPPPDPLESTDILNRTTPETGTVWVQTILIGWKDVPLAQQMKLDPRAAARTKADADKVAKDVLAKVRAKADMAKLMKEFSEEPGSKDTGKAYDLSPQTQVGPLEPFKRLALRLKVNEAGLVKTPIGWSIVKRLTGKPVEPPDSLESADILKRAPKTEKAKVKHILLGWKDVHAGNDPRSQRDRAALEKLVKETVAKLKKGDKIEPLMAELSEDPGSAKTGTGYDVTPDAGLVPPFKNLSLRLDKNEVGVVKTDFGIHIIQRIE